MKPSDRNPYLKVRLALLRPTPRKYALACLASLSLPSLLWSQGSGGGTSRVEGGFDTVIGTAVRPLPLPRLAPAQGEESILDEPQTPSHRMPTRRSDYEGAADEEDEEELNGKVPDFLSLPEIPTASEAAYAPPPPPQTMARPADQPGTILTQVEIPLPPATAEPLTMSESVPSGYNSPGYNSPGFTAPPAFVAQAPASGSGGGSLSTAPAYATETETQSPVYIPRQLDDPSPTTADIPPPPEHVSPEIIYDDGQQGVPRPPEPDPGPNISGMLANRQYAEVEALAATNRDSQLASALGWARYRDGNNQLAYQWFEQALQWNNGNNEAAYGLALTLFRMGRYDQAEQVARWRVDQYPRMQKVLADISSRRAVTSLRSRDHQGSSRNLSRTRKRRALTHQEKIVAAWNLYNKGEVEKARQEFIRLYEAKPDRYAAHGIYTVYASRRDWDGLETLVRKYRGPLADLYKTRIAEKYYDLGLTRMAYQTDPKRYRDLQGLTSPVVGVEVLGRTRSGTDGTSQLSEYGARLRATVYAKDRHRIDAAVGVAHLDSGNLQQGTRIGHEPADGVVRPYRYKPKTSYADLIDFRVRWEYQGPITPMIELGITPANGEIDPTFVGALGIRSTETWGNWTAEIYRNPVKDSLLSYTGLRDPYTGKKWGRVTETGGRFSMFRQLEDRWAVYGAASAGMLMGHNVPDNSHGALTLAVNKTIDYEGFEYIAVGPALGLDFYNRNLSQFTYGHGGYFSPEYLVQAALAGQFMTKQGGSALLRGSLSLGVQMNRQEAAPLFPNKPDGRYYSALTSSGVAVGVDLEGLAMLSDHWALGGHLGVNVAPNYNDFSLRVSFQYFFEPRTGLFAQDFFRF